MNTKMAHHPGGLWIKKISFILNFQGHPAKPNQPFLTSRLFQLGTKGEKEALSLK